MGSTCLENSPGNAMGFHVRQLPQFQASHIIDGLPWLLGQPEVTSAGVVWVGVKIALWCPFNPDPEKVPTAKGAHKAILVPICFP